MARDATAVAGLAVLIAGKAPLAKPLGSSARLLFPAETYQQIGSGRLSYSRGGFREASGRPRAARMSPAAGRVAEDNPLALPQAPVCVNPRRAESTQSTLFFICCGWRPPARLPPPVTFRAREGPPPHDPGAAPAGQSPST